MSLSGKVCLVTGSSKGIGRGIALQLGGHGATVYVTGRSKDKLESCVEEINKRGGKGISVVVDHSNDEQVEALFDQIKTENNGRLDVLVNNAYAGVETIFTSMQKKLKFYDMDPSEQWDKINGVGLRNHFLCTVFASRIMVDRRDGLIVNVSSSGGIKYLFNVAYGVGKAACDRMAADCAVELKDNFVTMVSLWPGPVKTEYIQDKLINADDPAASKQGDMFEKLGESIEFAGMAVSKLAMDPNKLSKSGKILLTGDLAQEYNFEDLDGSTHDIRSISVLLKAMGWNWTSWFIPSFIRIPHFVMHFGSNKF